MKHFLFLATFLASFYGQAQSEPTLFEPERISNGGVFGLTISPDSQIALWVSSNGKRDTLKIMESHKIKGQWSSPTIASFSTAQGQWKDIDPMFSPDGKTVFFQSTRTTGRAVHRTDFDIWAVTRRKRGWSEPYHLGNFINGEESESYASMAKNKNIYFMKENEDKIGKSDIYVSEYKNGVYQTPKNVGLPINTSARESNPFVSPDEDYLIYFSSDSTGYGEVDLFISIKKEGKWTNPKNLGQPINSSMAEFCPFVHQKEKKLYFSRQQKQPNKLKEDIYSVDFDVRKYLP